MKNTASKNTAETYSRPPSLTVLRWILVVAWVAVLFLIGPSVPLPWPIVGAIGYAGLSFVLVNALWQHMPLKAACIMAAILAGVLGVLAEAILFLAAGSVVTPTDWLANAAGAIVGAAIAYPLIQKVDALVSR